MAKLTTITIDNKLYDIGEIKRVSNLPSTITIDSPEIIIYNNELYIKHLTNGAYSYKNFAPPLTAGENISISDDGVISVTGELGTQIEANPELAGDETVLSSISIDGVNYEIGGSNDTNKVDLSTPFTSMGEIVIAQDTTGVQGSGVQVSDLVTKDELGQLDLGAPITPVEVLPEATEDNLNQYKIYEKDGTLGYLFNKALEEPVYNTLTVDAQISTSARTKMVAYKNKLYFTNGSSLYEFDPSTNTQTLLYTDSSYLISNAGIAAYNDLIYLFGAHTYSSSKVYHTYSRVLTYDLNTKTTTTRASLPDECIDMGCVVVGNCAYLFGGRYLWYAYSYNHTTCKS